MGEIRATGVELRGNGVACGIAIGLGPTPGSAQDKTPVIDVVMALPAAISFAQSLSTRCSVGASARSAVPR